MTDHSRVPSAPSRDHYEHQIDVADWLRMLLGQRRLITSAAFAGVIVAALVSYAFPPDYVATIQVVIATRPNTELTVAMVANYRRGFDSAVAAQQVVDEHRLDKAPHHMSASQLRLQTVVSPADAANVLTIEVRSNDPGVAERAATSLARLGMDSARSIEERSRILGELGGVLRLQEELPGLLVDIQSQDVGQRMLEDQLKEPSLRTESLKSEMVLGRVRLALLHARMNYILKGIKTATEFADKLNQLPQDSGPPASLIMESRSFASSFGVRVGESSQLGSPLRVLSKASVSAPPGLRRWATNLSVGFVLGLLLAVSISGVHYVVFAWRKPVIA